MGIQFSRSLCKADHSSGYACFWRIAIGNSFLRVTICLRISCFASVLKHLKEDLLGRLLIEPQIRLCIIDMLNVYYFQVGNKA